MKKIIEIDDELYEKLEKIQKNYHIKTVSPVISLILTLGVKWFEKLNDITPTMNVPTPIPYPVPYYYPWVPAQPDPFPYQPCYPWSETSDSEPWQYRVWCSDGTTVFITGLATTYTVGNWDVSSNISGMSFNYVGQ